MTLEDTFRNFIKTEVQSALEEMQLRPEGDLTTVGLTGTHNTIQAAWDDTQGTSPIIIHESYDPGNEEYPITFDVGQDQGLVLSSPGYSTVDIGHTDVDGPVIHIKGSGVGSYAQAPSISGVRIVGGSPGLKIESAPFAHLESVCFYKATGHGLEICDGANNTYGTQLYGCQAWNCQGDGFHLASDAGTHATGFYGCNATANGGVGYRLRGFTTGVYGGVSQYNHQAGIRCDAPAQSVQNVYVEGNGRKADYPVALYAKDADGLTVSQCYFNGESYSRKRWTDFETSMRGVNVHDSNSVSVENNVVRNYDDRFIKGFNSEITERGNYMMDGTVVQ